MLTDEQIGAVRKHFPILQQKTYLYSCSQGALSDAVEGGMREYAESWRTSAAPWDEWMGRYEALRATFARFINAQPQEVAIVASASAGINPIASALCFDDRNKVVMSEYEFPTMGHIWLAQRPRGAVVHFLEPTTALPACGLSTTGLPACGLSGTGLPACAFPDSLPTQSYEQAIDEQTRIVPLTQVSFKNGLRSDIAGVTKIAHERGALVFLDGYQDCGTRPLDVKALDVDFFVTGTLKYLLGPPGLGFLYVRRELIESLMPTMTSWMAQRDVFSFQTQLLDPSPDARRFEGGTPPIPNIYMAQPALDLLMRIGMDKVAAQVERLARAFIEGARDLGISSKTPASSVGPLVVLRSTDPATVLARLTARDIVVSTREDGVRFAFHVYNALDDVHTALSALKDNLHLMVRA